MPDYPVYWLGEDLVRFPCFVHLLEIDRNYGLEGDTEAAASQEEIKLKNPEKIEVELPGDDKMTECNGSY